MLYSVEQVKALPMAKFEITDSQVCTQHTAPAHLHSTLISIALLAADHERMPHLHPGWHN